MYIHHCSTTFLLVCAVSFLLSHGFILDSIFICFILFCWSTTSTDSFRYLFWVNLKSLFLSFSVIFSFSAYGYPYHVSCQVRYHKRGKQDTLLYYKPPCFQLAYSSSISKGLKDKWHKLNDWVNGNEINFIISQLKLR